MKFDSTNDTLANHFLKFDKSIRDLRSTGATLKETDIVCHLLLTMPNEYEVVITALETLSKEDLTLNFVKNRLLKEELKRRSTGVTKKEGDSFNTMAFLSTRSFSKEGWNNKNKNGKTKSENFRKNVSSKANIASKQFENLCKDEEESESLCFLATINYTSESSISYFLDSGATEHLVIAKSGAHIKADKVGDIVSEVNGKEYFIKAKDVLSVSGLNHNLLSVRKLETNEFEVVFKNGRGLIKKKNCVVAVASTTESQMYLVKCKYKTALANACLIIEDMNLWHKRFGHLNFESLKKLQGEVEVLALSAESFVNNVPTCYEEIETHQDKQEWFQAVQEKIEPLKEDDTWELMKLPPGRRFLDSKWVFKIKEDRNGNVERYKARLVIKGCAQQKGYDYEETYAPVAKLTTLRTLISVIREKDLYACQMDVKNAFLQGKIKEEIYMKI
ncbi:hypothetical protein ILUMI_18933, partial [Ignelater luminosus]